MSAIHHPKHRIAILLLLLMLVSHRIGWAAAIHTETFASGTAGWTKAGTWQIVATNQALQGTFTKQPVPFPETGAFVATSLASGGAFTGDYDTAGIQLVGFSFMAQDVVPSAALLRWSNPTSSFFRSFASAVTQTGVWYRFAFSLRSKDAGQWVGGTAAAFNDGLLDVKTLEIQLTRAGMAAQRYHIDDVFTDTLPVGALAGMKPLRVNWSSLRSTVGYVVEAADDPNSSWNMIDSFVATDSTHTWHDGTVTNVNQRIYRLRFLEYH